MGDNLFRVLLTSIKAKVTPLVTKVKMWTSWNFIRTNIIAKIRDFFTSLLDVRPRHKKDYYSVFGWLVSRRLAMAVVVAAGVLSLYYLFSTCKTLTHAGEEGIKTYDYDSIMLRFAEGKVRIRGKSGYLAYEGCRSGHLHRDPLPRRQGCRQEYQVNLLYRSRRRTGRQFLLCRYALLRFARGYHRLHRDRSVRFRLGSALPFRFLDPRAV